MVDCKGNCPLQFLETRSNNHSLKILSAVRRNAKQVWRKTACFSQEKWPNSYHVAKVTKTKLNNLGIEVLLHPPYSYNLSSTNFHFFKHLDNFTKNRQFHNHAALEEAFKDFIESRDVEFYKNSINDLITRWQKCIQSQRCYFD